MKTLGTAVLLALLMLVGFERDDIEAQASAAPPSPTVKMRGAADASRTLLTTRTPELPEHAEGVSGVAFSPDGRWVATAGNDFKVKICDAATGQLKHDLTFGKSESIFGSLNAVAFAPKSTQLAVASNKVVGLFDFETGKLQKRLAREGFDDFEFLRFTPAGDRLVALSGRRVGVWSAPDGRFLREFSLSAFFPEAFALTPDGRHLAIEGSENSVELYDLRTGKSEHVFRGAHEGGVSCVAINHDGSLLAAVDLDDRLVVYDLEKRAECFRSDKHSCSALAFSPDGLLAIGFYSIELFVLGEDKIHKVGSCSLRGETAASAIAFSPDGSRMITTDQSHQRRGDLFQLDWSLENKTAVGQRKRIDDIAVSHNGKWLGWADQETLALHSIQDGKPVATTELPKAPRGLRSIDFAPDNSLMALRLGGSFDGVLHVYTFPN